VENTELTWVLKRTSEVSFPREDLEAGGDACRVCCWEQMPTEWNFWYKTPAGQISRRSHVTSFHPFFFLSWSCFCGPYHFKKLAISGRGRSIHSASEQVSSPTSPFLGGPVNPINLVLSVEHGPRNHCALSRGPCPPHRAERS
jgi:hypothetical protein